MQLGGRQKHKLAQVQMSLLLSDANLMALVNNHESSFKDYYLCVTAMFTAVLGKN